MTLGRLAWLGRRRVAGPRRATLAEHFDLAGLDQLLQLGALQRVVLDLAGAAQTEMQRLAAGQRDPERLAALVDDGSDGRLSSATGGRP
jgi:hypothetical protein